MKLIFLIVLFIMIVKELKSQDLIQKEITKELPLCEYEFRFIGSGVDNILFPDSIIKKNSIKKISKICRNYNEKNEPNEKDKIIEIFEYSQKGLLISYTTRDLKRRYKFAKKYKHQILIQYDSTGYPIEYKAYSNSNFMRNFNLYMTVR